MSRSHGLARAALFFFVALPRATALYFARALYLRALLSESSPSHTPPHIYTRRLLSGLRIKGTIPINVGLMTELNTLGLDGNEISGTVPDAFNQLTKLTVLCVRLQASSLATSSCPSPRTGRAFAHRVPPHFVRFWHTFTGT